MIKTITNPIGDVCEIRDDESFKAVSSKDYNYIFDKKNGTFLRWGETENDDPPYAPFGPEILDLEISVNGCPNNCAFCYKGNTSAAPKNMSFDTFKKIVDKFPPTLTQIAFGITGVKINPNFIKMMEYCREIGIIPNFTLTGLDMDLAIAQRFSKLVGAVAVSIYPNWKDTGYNTVKILSQDLGIKQTNVHLMISNESIHHVKNVIRDYIAGNKMLKNVNAFVFLGLKPKGRAAGRFSVLRFGEFRELIKLCMENNVPIGFDSCTSFRFDIAIRDIEMSDERRADLLKCSESCESGAMSSYINVDGMYFPCSFCEDEVAGINVLERDNFMDVWYDSDVVSWRNKMIENSVGGVRLCPIFPEVSSINI